MPHTITTTSLPLFRCTKVEVVDTIEVHVLCVPGKAGLPHPKVEVGSVHSRDVYPILSRDCVQDGVQTIDVPLLHIRLSEGARDVCTIQWLVEGDVLPIFSLQLFIILCLGRLVPVRSA